MPIYGVDNFVLTRFNVRRSSAPKLILSTDWLLNRLELFEDYCFPSMVRQSMLPRAWLIFFDIKTPLDIRDRFESIVTNWPFIKPIYCDGLDATIAANHIKPLLSPDCRWVITTRLDNDDAVHPHLLELVANAASIGNFEFINATNGLVVTQNRFYRKGDRSNPFISASEPVESFRTVWMDQHHRLGKYAPIKQLPIKDAWIQIIHATNLANRVRGIRVPSYTIEREDLPPRLAERMRKEPLSELIIDNTAGFLIRYSGSLFQWIKVRVIEFKGQA